MAPEVHRKTRLGAPPGFFACEAAGLAWLAVPGGVRVVQVLSVDEDALVLERLPHRSPAAADAEAFGAALAVTHAAGAEAFGAPPAGWHGDGFFGPLADPRPLPTGRSARWGEFHAQCRVDPLREELAAVGRLSHRADAALRRLADRLRSGTEDDVEVPARVHGDLWSGNVVWTPRATLVDPAAHGGHPLTDLAMLALFGLPHLDRTLDAYEEAAALPDGWRERLSLHQVHPVGMHAVLFGGTYTAQLEALLRRWA